MAASEGAKALKKHLVSVMKEALEPLGFKYVPGQFVREFPNVTHIVKIVRSTFGPACDVDYSVYLFLPRPLEKGSKLGYCDFWGVLGQALESDPKTRPQARYIGRYLYKIALDRYLGLDEVRERNAMRDQLLTEDPRSEFYDPTIKVPKGMETETFKNLVAMDAELWFGKLDTIEKVVTAINDHDKTGNTILMPSMFARQKLIARGFKVNAKPPESIGGLP